MISGRYFLGRIFATLVVSVSVCICTCLGPGTTTSLALVTYDMVTIGDTGNAAYTTVSGATFGAVGSTYQIATTEVTNADYAEFLNTRTPTQISTYGLYHTGMDIVLSSGVYIPDPGDGGWGENPLRSVDFWNAIRFINWLHNGQGTGDTETGAYAIQALWNTDNSTATGARLADAKYFLPTEDEWFKAAYYDPDTDSYSLYPTQSSTQPTAEAPPGAGPNSANYDDTKIAPTLKTTAVEAYTSTTSFYGLFDMAGNVEEWLETFSEAPLTPGYRGARGGQWKAGDTGETTLNASAWTDDDIKNFRKSRDEDEFRGFRVAAAVLAEEPPGPQPAAIPEPSLLLFLTGGGLIVWYLRRHG